MKSNIQRTVTHSGFNHNFLYEFIFLSLVVFLRRSLLFLVYVLAGRVFFFCTSVIFLFDLLAWEKAKGLFGLWVGPKHRELV